MMEYWVEKRMAVYFKKIEDQFFIFDRIIPLFPYFNRTTLRLSAAWGEVPNLSTHKTGRIGNEKLHNTLRLSGKMSNISLYLFVTVGAVGIAPGAADE